ncbi:hypothetical protein ACJ41O_012080 [Fusarium nematophilum]
MAFELLNFLFRGFFNRYCGYEALDTSSGDTVSDDDTVSDPPHSASPIQIDAYFKLLRTSESLLPIYCPPPPNQDGPRGPLCRLVFIFGSDADKLRSGEPLDLDEEWAAQLDLVTWDLPGVMHNGLYVTAENVKELENHLVEAWSHEHKRWISDRSYSVVDSRWSGRLNVCAWHPGPVSKFRIHHLSAEKVFSAIVGSSERDTVYWYNLHAPKDNLNCIYDDMPIDGLWPWPRHEGGVEGVASKADRED